MNYFVWQRTCVDESGNVLPSASVTVTDVISGSLATLYSDEGSTGAGNPISADSNGFVQFFVKAGIYTIVATSGANTRTWTKEAIGSPFKRTPAETTAGVTPTNYQYPERHALRYGTNTTPGTTDMTAAFQAAIDVASQVQDVEVGRKVYFPGGLYLITAPLTIEANGVELIADGVVRIAGNDIDDDYMLIVGGNSGSPIYNNAILGNFIWFRSQAAAAGTQGCIHWSYSNYGTLRGSRFYNGYAPVLVDNCTGVETDDLGFFETISGGIGGGAYLARYHTCAQLTIKRLQNFASFSSKANTKVIVDYNCDDVKVYGTTVGQVLLTRTGGGGTFAPRWVAIDSCYGESAEEIASFDFDDCKSVKMAKCHGAVGLVGISVGADCIGLDVTQCTFLDNDLDGVLIQGGTDIHIHDNDISSNNASGGGSPSGVRISGDCSDVSIINNRIKNHLASGNTHGYGVLVTGGLTVAGLTVEDNDIANYATAAFLDNAGATDKRVRRNRGYVTEASGTGSIASGATTAVITHGLSVTPTATDIIINFTEQGTNDYGRSWISTITSTQFTVNVSADPGASNLDFSWRVVS